MKAILLLMALSSCANPFEKDNDAKEPVDGYADLAIKLEGYQIRAADQLDDYLMVTPDGEIGDSALFSCLAMAGGVTDVDPYSVVTGDGKPRRHPLISPRHSATPVSRDMVAGILWCVLSLYEDNKDQARDTLKRLIAYIKANGGKICSASDKKTYNISDKDFAGRCTMTPSGIKDVYRLAQYMGMSCDAHCKNYLKYSFNVPSDETGFRRHLSVITTLRNGLIEGKINDNSLKNVLKNAAEANPSNALYVAAYHTFTDGDQSAAAKLLMDTAHWPDNALPTKENHCAAYIYQRDETSDDWKPCPGDGDNEGFGIDFIFAASLVLGRLPGQGHVQLTGGIR